jgi:Flp pilus assembly protein TadB
MSSSGAGYTEQQKTDRAAVTTALTDPTNAQVMQDQGDSSLRKRAENKAAIAAQAAKAKAAAEAAEGKKCMSQLIYSLYLSLIITFMKSYFVSSNVLLVALLSSNDGLMLKVEGLPSMDSC